MSFLPCRPAALLLLLVTATSTLSAQEQTIPSPMEGGREFWGVFEKNYMDWTIDQQTRGLKRADELKLSLAISSEKQARVTVEIPGIRFHRTVNIAPGTTQWVAIDSAAQLRSSLVPERLAFHITSDAPIVVTGSSRRFQTTDLFQVFPVEALGTRYRAVGYKPLQRDLQSQFAVVATEENTTVRIVPTAEIIKVEYRKVDAATAERERRMKEELARVKDSVNRLRVSLNRSLDSAIRSLDGALDSTIRAADEAVTRATLEADRAERTRKSPRFRRSNSGGETDALFGNEGSLSEKAPSYQTELRQLDRTLDSTMSSADRAIRAAHRALDSTLKIVEIQRARHSMDSAWNAADRTAAQIRRERNQRRTTRRSWETNASLDTPSIDTPTRESLSALRPESDTGSRAQYSSRQQREPVPSLYSPDVTLPRNEPVTITLQRGEAVQVISRFRPGRLSDITGSLIESDKPVAVFSGHNCAYVPDATVKACNTLVEQLPPTSSWGSRFVAAPPPGRSSAVLRVLADRDSTVVSYGDMIRATLRAGEFYEDTDLRQPTMVSTSRPALAALYSKGFDNGDGVGDPSMTIVPPLHQHALGYRLLPAPIMGSWKHTLLLALPSASVSSLRLNEVPVKPTSVQSISGSNYSVVGIELPRDAATITCDVAFGAMQFGLGYEEAAYDAYGFAYGYPLPSPEAEMRKEETRFPRFSDSDNEDVLTPVETAPTAVEPAPVEEGSGVVKPRVENR